MQLYLPVTVSAPERTSAYAKALAEELAAETPRLVTAVMAKAGAVAGCSSTGARTTRTRRRSPATPCVAGPADRRHAR